MIIVVKMEKDEEFGNTCIQDQSEGVSKEAMKREAEWKAASNLHHCYLHWEDFTMCNITCDIRKLNFPSKIRACLPPLKSYSHHQILLLCLFWKDVVDILFGKSKKEKQTWGTPMGSERHLHRHCHTYPPSTQNTFCLRQKDLDLFWIMMGSLLGDSPLFI